MKVPEPRKLPSGQYYIQLRLGGKSYPFTYPTAKECRDAARTFKSDYLAGRIEEAAEKESSPVIPTLGSVIDAYIERSPSLSPATIRGYDIIRKHRFKNYMDLPYNAIDFQEMLNEEIEISSPKTIKNGWALVRRALKKEAGLVIQQDDYSIPRVPIKHLPYLRPDEIQPFCAALRGNIAEIPLLFELHGLRRSEVLALTWEENIDLKHGMIRVYGASVQNKDAVFVRKKTNKNDTSTRTVPIMIPRLKELLTEQTPKTGPVVKVNPDTMLYNVNKVCKDAGVTVVSNHGLRYSFASLGYHLKLSERQIMELGGWADINTMHKIYIRIAQEDIKSAENAMTDFFSSLS